MTKTGMLRLAAVAVVAFAAAGATAQTEKPKAADIAQTVPQEQHFYRLDFTLKEVEDGKIINSRTYSTSTSTERGSSGDLKSGSRVPLMVASQNGSPAATQYLDVGVNVKCYQVREVEGKLAMQVDADISVLAEKQEGAASPVVRQNRWRADVMVTPGKPTIVFSSDDMASKRKTQLELTATQIK